MPFLLRVATRDDVALLADMHTRSRAATYRGQVLLESNVDAIGFYESRGWVRIDRVNDVWAGSVAVTALVYASDLT
jgi:hypothetical protein